MLAKVALLKSIAQEGVQYLFMVPGGLVDPFLTAFEAAPEITPIIAAQEGGACFMADGYARASGLFGACLGIGGPGITNMVTAILTARSDRSPVLVISGEISSQIEGLGFFQDSSVPALDDFEMIEPAAQYSITVENAKLFHHHLRQAMHRMLGTDRGPVHVCLPKDIQNSEVSDGCPSIPSVYYHAGILDHVAAEQCVPKLAVEKLVILAGEGVHTAQGSQLLLACAAQYGIPIATTLRAKGVFPEDHPLSLGVFGYAGTQQAAKALLDSGVETLIVLGSGLNQRDSMFYDQRLNPSHCLLQVNVDPYAFSYAYKDTCVVQSDCQAFLQFLLDKRDSQILAQKSNRLRWWQEIAANTPRFYDAENLDSTLEPLHPARVLKELRLQAPRDTVLVVDSGAHRAFCGHYWQCYGPGQYISATNLGPMGWAIPAGIGVKLAKPEQPCCVITGDGCMLMHGMEIHTAARYGVPVIYVVLNNAAFGNVYLRARNEGEVPKELTSLPNRDFAAFARALGAESSTVEHPDQLAGVFAQAFKANKTYVIDVKCGKDYSTPVEPFVQAQKAWSYHD